MKQRGWIILKTLFNRYDANIQNALFEFLTPETKQKIQKNEIQSKNLLPLLYQHQDTLERMHYSWLKPLLQQFPEQLIPMFVNALTQEQAIGFKSSAVPILHLPQSVKLFLQNRLYNLLDVNNRQPLEFLTVTEMTPLAYLNKTELMAICDFLGLYDLASEVRQIVNKTYLKNIYACLTPKQFYYLKACLHQKEKLTTPPLGIDPSKQDCPKLKRLVHQRGLVRLGKALCGQDKDLIWYIAHILDTGRGKILLDHYKIQEVPSVTSFLKLQLTNVMNFLKSE
jgi:hypothetical protein